MDRKTQLTMYVPEFINSWNNYKKGLKGLKITNWCISSDYCFDDPDKLEVATFTIFPANYIKILSQEIKENLPHDIKQTKEFSEKELNYLKNITYCFSVSFIINDIDRCFNKDEALYQCEKQLKLKIDDIPFEITEKDFHEKRKQLHELLNTLKKKSFPQKRFAQMYFIAHSVAQIIEFLIIREKAKIIGWCSDRGHIASFVNGVIFNLIPMYVHSYVKDRRHDYYLTFPPEYYDDLDLLIRIPDIITGAFSSLITSSRGISAQKIKHQQLILNSIMNNKRIVSLAYNFDKNDQIYGHRIMFETLDQSPLFRFEREYLEQNLL